MDNGFLFNPAMAGYDGYTSLNLTARKQWMNFPGAPLTYSISAQTRLFRQAHRIVSMPSGRNKFKGSTQGRVGIGGSLYNDVNGQVSRTGFQFTYAYHIYLYRSQLSFGLTGQFFQYKIGDSLSYQQMGDPLFASGINRVAFIPDANFGAFWTAEEYYLGFSSNQLFESVLKIGSNDLSELKLLRHYYLMGGYRFINKYSGFDFEPSFLIKSTEQLMAQADISLKLYYQTDYWAGLSYRTNNSVAVLFGVRADKIYFGYAYDYSLATIRKYSFGSHEIFISYKIGSNDRRYRWLNRY
jgi:type IX secretion system PorP/SprF family membrane protein